MPSKAEFLTTFKSAKSVINFFSKLSLLSSLEYFPIVPEPLNWLICLKTKDGMLCESFSFTSFSTCLICSGAKPAFLNLGTIDILGQKILCCGSCSVHCSMFNSIPILYLLDVSSPCSPVVGSHSLLPGIKPWSPTLQADPSLPEPPREPYNPVMCL